jgi:hypothetical protein
MMDTQKEIKTIEVDSMVTLMIGEDHWIGQVVELRNDVALVRLLDNMHYHAKLEELELLTQ